jgi:iron(III) transport system permease protein
MATIAVVVTLVIVLLLAVVGWLSITDGALDSAKRSYSFRNYSSVFLDPYTYIVLFNTLVFSSISLGVALGVAVPIAWIVERTDFPGKPAVFTLMTTALLIPGFSVALGWLFLLHPRIGIINLGLQNWLGLTDAPFNVTTLVGMGIVEGLSLVPAAFLMTAIVFRNMDASLEEAACVSGARRWQTLLRVTFPLAWPAILGAGIYIFTIGFSAFDIPAILGVPQRIYTFSTYVQHLVSPADGPPEFGTVAALSVIMVGLAAVLSAWYRQMQRHSSRYEVVTGKGFRPAIVNLGRGRVPALVFVGGYFVIAQLMPLSMLLWAAGLPYVQAPSLEAISQLSLNNIWSVPEGLIPRALLNTAILMIVVPTLTMIVSLAFSWVIMRSDIALRGMYDFFAFLPHAVPSIIFSVAAWLLSLFVFTNVLPIYGTLWVLIIVYVIVRISYGTRMTGGALIQIHKELEEAAKTSGAQTGRIVWSIILPLLTPTMVYAWIWIALLSYRDLTIPVILATPDNLPISVLVWSLAVGGSYSQAAAVAVLMLVVIFPILPIYWMLARRIGILPSQ